jgi:hypothetical protein
LPICSGHDDESSGYHGGVEGVRGKPCEVRDNAHEQRHSTVGEGKDTTDMRRREVTTRKRRDTRAACARTQIHTQMGVGEGGHVAAWRAKRRKLVTVHQDHPLTQSPPPCQSSCRGYTPTNGHPIVSTKVLKVRTQRWSVYWLKAAVYALSPPGTLGTNAG